MKFFALLLCGWLLISCSQLPIEKQESKGQNARIQTLILHFTAGNYKRSIFALKESGAVSSHYLVPSSKDDSYPKSRLEVIQLVDESQRAWHAGYSHWQGRDNLNDTSIGIEIVNEPDCGSDAIESNFFGGEFGPYRQCKFPQFDAAQIQLVTKLAQDVLSRHPDIDPTRVIGHSDIAPGRKNDPGPSFPWFQLYENGVGAWYEQETLEQYQTMFAIHPPSIALIQKALRFYGYKIKETGILDKQSQNVVQAFKFHFLPEQADAIASIKMSSALFALIERYRDEYLETLLRNYFNDAYLALGGDTVIDQSLMTEQEALEHQQLVKLITERTLAFNAATGATILSLSQPTLNELPQLKLHLNGRYISLDFAKTTAGKLEIDIGRWTRNGKNVVHVSSESDLSQLQLRVTGTELIYSNKHENRLPIIDKLAKGASLNGSVLLAKHGKVVKHQQYGKPPKKLVLSDNSALFTSYLALFSLASEQGVGLRDFVVEHMPEYQVSGAQSLKVINLLNHTSGYGELFANDVEQIPPWMLDEQERRAHIMSQLPFQYSLNTHYVSDINLYVLNQMIESSSQITLEQYLSSYIWQPLGLTETRLIYNSVTGLPSLETNEHELLVLMQLLLNHGRYGDTQVFNDSDIFDWFLQQQTIANKSRAASQLGKNLNASHCVPYLTEHTLLILSDSGQLYLLDHEHQLLILLSTSEKQQLDPSLFSCGMSLFHQDILNHVYAQIFQGKL